MKYIHRILFVNPPDPSLIEDAGPEQYNNYFEPPLGLFYVYDYVKRRNEFDLKLVDLNIEIKFLSKRTMPEILDAVLDEFKPDLVAISALYYSSIDTYHLLAKIIKRKQAEALVAMGGYYPTHLTEKCLADPNVDYLVLSEGEMGFSDLIDALNGKIKREEVEGLAFRREGCIQNNPRKRLWRGFGEVPRIPWEDTHFSFYFREGRNVLHRVKNKQSIRPAAITASRGCPNRCTFCTSPAFWGGRWRHRKVSSVVEEINYLKDTFDVNTIIFNDENISASRTWFLELLDGLEPLGVQWISSGGLSPRPLNDELVVRKMYDSGVALFNIAIESGSNRTLQKVQKRLSIEETENVVQLIRRFGSAYITGFFITGFPFEDMAGVKQTLSFAERLDLDWKCFYCFQPFPGSELFDYCMDNHLVDSFDPHYREVYFAPKLKYPDYTPQYLSEVNYFYNLKCNFFLNRNLQRKTPESLAQAERDFRYVLDIVPEHLFAYWGLAEVAKIRNESDAYIQCVRRMETILKKYPNQWEEYMNRLGVEMKNL